MNFKQIKSDACVHENSDASIIILIYVDDEILAARIRKSAQKVISELSNRFRVREMSGSMFLGIELVEFASGLRLSQKRYVDDILKRFNMIDAKLSETLYLDVESGDEDGNERTQAPYREAIGCLTYLTSCTRPDIL